MGVTEAGLERDGSRRLLAFGLRALQELDGSIEVSDELLPVARNARFLELPTRLGGGFLFWIVSSSGTLVYRSATWTAKLVPLAQLDFEVERFVPGFDRLLVLPRRDAEYRALDVETGQPLPPLGLPPAPAYGAMAFVDDWFAAVQVPLRGTLLSFDAGASWRPLSLPVTSFELSSDSLSLTGPSGDYLLDARGLLSRVAERARTQAHEAAPTEPAEPAERAATRTHAAPLLEMAVLSGFPAGPGEALVASGGTLSRISLDTGKVLQERPRAYVGSGECQGVRIGSGVGFVCGQGRDFTRIYRVTGSLELALVTELPGPRVVSDSGSGALVVHGACGGAGERFEHCIVGAQGLPFSIRGSTERDRVIALSDGSVVVVTPPDARTAGSLTRWKVGVSKRVPLSLTRSEPQHKSLLEHGIWLDGAVEAKPGVISGWVVGAGPFAGFELTLDGKLTLRRVQDNAGRALFDGPRALVLGDNGLAAESTDGGVEWRSVELPPEIDLKAAAAAGVKQGCTAVGCGFAGFTRVGYLAGRSAPGLASPAAPPRVAFPGPGGSRWLLHCAASGELSPPALPSRARTAGTRRLRRASVAATPAEDDAEHVPLSPLLDRAPPALPADFEGVDAGTEPYAIQSRVYAYGPRGADWTKAGTLSIAFVDRFQVGPAVRVTAGARSPWPDAISAADALGAEPSSAAAGLAVALDPGGTAGALLLSSRGSLDLFVFEEGRVPQRVPNVARLGMASRLSGAVKTKAGTFLGSYDENTRAFRVYRVTGQDLEVALEVADIPTPRGAQPELARSDAGDALAIWVRGTGWFVHPIDLETGTVDAPYVVTPAQLASMPEVCAENTEGYLLAGAIGPDPHADTAPGVSMRAFEGRFRVSALGVCIDALAAQGEAAAAALAADAPRASAARAAGRATVQVALTERKPLGRRVGLRCSN